MVSEIASLEDIARIETRTSFLAPVNLDIDVFSAAFGGKSVSSPPALPPSEML